MADAPQFIAGLQGTQSFGTDERPKNFREAILWLDPNGMTPITALSARMKTESTDDPEFAWWEEVQDAKRAAVDSGGTTTAINLTEPQTINPQTIGPAFMYKAGDILMLFEAAAGQPDNYETGSEIVKVLTVADNDDITVTRAYDSAGVGGGSGPTVKTLVAGDQFNYIGSEYAEGSAGADPLSGRPQKNLNYTQIFKTSFELTNTARATRYRTGDAFANSRKRAMFKHSEGLEMSVLFGKKLEQAGSGATMPLRLSGGLRFFFTSNSTGNVGVIDEDFFLDTLSPLFDYNAGGAGDQRICFIGNGALNAIQKVVRDASGTRVQYQGRIKFFGMNLLEYQIPQGTFFLKSHPLLNTDPIYRDSMFVTNPRGIIRRPLRGRDTKIQTEIQNNDVDTRKDQWLSEVGWEIQYQRTQGYFGNIS